MDDIPEGLEEIFVENEDTSEEPSETTEDIEEEEAPLDEEEPDPSVDTQDDDSSDSDTLTLEDDDLVMWVNEDGKEEPVPWHTIRGSVKFKRDYDAWLENEKKPLEEKSAQLEEVTTNWQHDPEYFVYSHVLEMQRAGMDDVVLARKEKDEYGNDTLVEYKPESKGPPPKRNAPDIPEEISHELDSTKDELFELRALRDNPVDDEVLESARELYSKYKPMFTEENGDNPFLPALELASARAGKTPQKPSQTKKPRRSPAKPRTPQGLKDQKEKELYEAGILKQG